MTKRKNARTQQHQFASFDQNIDYNDDANVNRDATFNENDVIIVASNPNQIVTLKHIIETHKIKCDPKLIRRVLRKYYAHKIDHKLRDAWTFNASQINDVVTLIDTHCRAGKSQND